MNILKAETILSNLMDKHLDSSWRYKFGHASRLFGYCSYTNKTITLSQPLVELNSEEEVTNTILHEIAHALAGHGAGHGQRWVAVAKSIGCDGNRCYGSHVIKPKGKWVAKCVHCSRKREFVRRRQGLACGACCRKHSRGKYDPRFTMAWKLIK